MFEAHAEPVCRTLTKSAMHDEIEVNQYNLSLVVQISNQLKAPPSMVTIYN
jgi:hypothetical protein